MKFLQRMMLVRIEGWVVALLGILVFLGIIAFGAVVKTTALGSATYGRLGEVALSIAEMPATARRAFRQITKGDRADLAARETRFGEITGFDFISGTRPDDGYLLLSRYDGDLGRTIVELVDLSDGSVLHTWKPDFAEINRLSRLDPALVDLAVDNGPGRARMMHPLAEPNGSLVYANASPLVRIDVCSRVVWTVDRIAHHAIEPHPEGGYWVSLRFEPKTVEGVSRDFIEDTIAHVSDDGRVLWEKSLPQMLIENGLMRLVFGLDFYSDDPLHLNDIEPVLTDGPYWKRGDVFLSMRNVSPVMLYRPSENRVVWLRQEPWVNQHDVVIVDDHRISVFNNNRMNRKWVASVEGSNDVMFYDFASDRVTSPFKPALEREEVRSHSEGRGLPMPDGGVFVEETNFGRILRLNAGGNVIWQYVNRGSDGRVFVLGWSRVVGRAEGDAILDSIEAARCDT